MGEALWRAVIYHRSRCSICTFHREDRETKDLSKARNFMWNNSYEVSNCTQDKNQHTHILEDVPER